MRILTILRATESENELWPPAAQCQGHCFEILESRIVDVMPITQIEGTNEKCINRLRFKIRGRVNVHSLFSVGQFKINNFNMEEAETWKQ